MLLQEWLPKWLDTYVKPTSKLRTYNRYYEIVYQHIIPQLGKCEIEDITPSTPQAPENGEEILKKTLILQE